MITEVGSERFAIADFKDGGRGPGGKKFGQPLGAAGKPLGKCKETDSLQGSRMESRPSDTLTLAW